MIVQYRWANLNSNLDYQISNL